MFIFAAALQFMAESDEKMQEASFLVFKISVLKFEEQCETNRPVCVSPLRTFYGICGR